MSVENSRKNLELANANNLRSYNTAISNNNRSYQTAVDNMAAVKQNAETAIQNAINQSYLGDNAVYGAPGDHSKWVNGLMAIHYHIKTQSEDAIARAGDHFLRYGYAFGGNCAFTGFNIMKYFTYWKCSEVWINSNKINNSVLRKLKDILKQGVTVWRNPGDIGNVTIYDNTFDDVPL